MEHSGFDFLGWSTTHGSYWYMVCRMDAASGGVRQLADRHRCPPVHPGRRCMAPWRDPWAVSQATSTGTTTSRIRPCHFRRSRPSPSCRSKYRGLAMDGHYDGGRAFSIRQLRLPWWWLLFPPLVEGILAGNPHVVMLGLCWSGPVLKAAAPVFKVYGAVPIIGERRWRALAISAALLAGSLVAAPSAWIDFFRRGSRLAPPPRRRMGMGYSAWPTPGMLLITAVAAVVLAVFDRRAAGWLAVPALWPDSQFFYGSLALPIAGPVMAAALAVPAHGVPALVVIAYTMVRLVRWYRNGRKSRNQTRVS